MDILDELILNNNQNKEYKYEDYKKEEAVDVEVTTVSLKDSGSAIKNPVMVTKGGIEPEGTLEITENGQYNVTEYAEANINVADIPAKLQTKTLTPTKSTQTVKPDSTYEGLSSVTVNPIPSNYIQPSGTLEITENGEKDVTNYSKVNVIVEGISDSGETLKSINVNTNVHLLDGYADDSFSEYLPANQLIDSILTDLDRETVKFTLKWMVDVDPGDVQDSVWGFDTPTGSIDITYTKGGELIMPDPFVIPNVKSNIFFKWESYGPASNPQEEYDLDSEYTTIGCMGGGNYWWNGMSTVPVFHPNYVMGNRINHLLMFVKSTTREYGSTTIDINISFVGGIYVDDKDYSIT